MKYSSTGTRYLRNPKCEAINTVKYPGAVSMPVEVKGNKATTTNTFDVDKTVCQVANRQ
jgi:hypothetical protein